jgi:hypothetical protein
VLGSCGWFARGVRVVCSNEKYKTAFSFQRESLMLPWIMVLQATFMTFAQRSPTQAKIGSSQDPSRAPGHTYARPIPACRKPPQGQGRNIPFKHQPASAELLHTGPTDYQLRLPKVAWDDGWGRRRGVSTPARPEAKTTKQRT